MKNRHIKSHKSHQIYCFLSLAINKTLFLFIFLSFISLLSASLSYTYFLEQNNSAKIQAELADKVLRFHVVANSDNTADQNVKMQVKAQTLNFLQPYLTDITSKEQAIAIINSHIEQIITVAANTVSKNGKTEAVTASIEKCYFPTKTYGDVTFPPGTYDALNIQIGEAKGHNWWCVMYPPLCFLDDTLGYLPADSKQVLQNTLSPKTYAYIQTNPQNNYNQKTTDTQAKSSPADSQTESSATSQGNCKDSQFSKIKIRFKIFTFLNNFMS